jgi:HAD superfamily hydrolase (TIGR01509 family)
VACKLVIFDCDGVLVDSEPISARVFAESLNDIGVPVDVATIANDFTGLSLKTSFAMVEERWGIELPADFFDTMQGRTLELLAAEVEAIPGVGEVLDLLDSRDMPKCVASSGNFQKMEVTLGRTGLLPRFDGNIFSAWQPEVKRGKPFPDLFLFAAENMGIEPQDCVVIEDSLHGIRAAQAAGMTPYGYVGGAHAFDLAGEGAVTFAAMADLPALLDLH